MKRTSSLIISSIFLISGFSQIGFSTPPLVFKPKIATLDDIIWRLSTLGTLPTDPNGDQIMDGYEVLNGGDAIVCPDALGGIQSVELLDVYETRTLRPHYVPEMGPNNLTALEKVEYVLKRLAIIDPVRAEKYLTALQDFISTTIFLPNVQLADVPDSAHIVLPKKCELQQIAIQLSNISLPEGTRIIVSEDLWNYLDSDNQAALILHEIIYQEAISLGHLNSFRVRYYNGFICSEAPAQITKNLYITSILRTVSLPFLAP